MIFIEHFTIKFSSVTPTTDAVYTPIIKYSSPSIPSAEALTVHSGFSKFLSEVNHHRISIHAGGNNKCRDSFAWVTGKEIGRNALLIVVFEEIKHLFLNSVQTLPAMSDRSSRLISTGYITKCII